MLNELKKTPLNAAHAAAGGKLVDFAGWEMPLHYGSQVAEHHLVRTAAGMFDVSHMLAIDLVGDQATAFLRRLLANDVAKLKEAGKALYSCMLRPDGCVIDDLIVYFFGPGDYRIVVNAGTADKDLAWMREQAASFGVTLEPRRDLAMIAVQGPQARAAVWRALPGSDSVSAHLKPFQAARLGAMTVCRTGYTGEDGFEIMVPVAAAEMLWNALIEAGVKPAGLGARDTLRLEAGMNLYGQDMDETVTPLESGLAWTVSLNDDRDFIGKPALMAQTSPRPFLGLLLLDKGVLRAHQKVVAANGEGEITSGSFSPTLNQSIALARLPVGTAVGDEVQVDVRGKLLKARVVKPVFARHGKSMIS
ncbi:MAG: glycine cleavage system aminomethyltransferase GcvT [Rhodocyclaceae bacterium]|nr:glycine cleavage system aminomethyltransferase GcvT [Rhodocyclaceae bacterium]